MGGLKKLSSVEWEKAIREARAYVFARKQSQMKVAEIAMRVCVIKHGGASKNPYSLNAFSLAIGIRHATLCNWVAVKRNVYDKLPVKERDNIPHGVLQDIKERVVNESTEAQVRIIAREETNRDPHAIKFAKYKKHLNSILHNVVTPIKLMEVPTETLEEFIRLCNKISEFMNKELEFRRMGLGKAKKENKEQLTKFTKAIKTIREK